MPAKQTRCCLFRTNSLRSFGQHAVLHQGTSDDEASRSRSARAGWGDRVGATESWFPRVGTDTSSRGWNLEGSWVPGVSLFSRQYGHTKTGLDSSTFVLVLGGRGVPTVLWRYHRGARLRWAWARSSFHRTFLLSFHVPFVIDRPECIAKCSWLLLHPRTRTVVAPCPAGLVLPSRKARGGRALPVIFKYQSVPGPSVCMLHLPN